jgi:hypothetical protein
MGAPRLTEGRFEAIAAMPIGRYNPARSLIVKGADGH